MVADEEHRDEREPAQDVRDDQDEPPVEAIDEHAGERREQHRRHEEREDQGADRGGRAVDFGDDDGQAEDDHVPADLGRRLGEPEEEERPVLEDGQRAAGGGRWAPGRRGRVPPPAGHGALGRGADRGADDRVAALHELGQPALDASAGRPARGGRSAAAKPDVGAEPVDEPVVAAARMGAPEPQDVAEEQLERGSRRSSGRGYQRRGWPWSGTRSRSRRRQRHRSSVGWTSIVGVRIRRGELGDDPAGPGQRPDERLRPPIARIVNGSPSGVSSTERDPGSPPIDRARDDPDVLDRDRLGAGVAELVDQVLDVRRADRAADRDRDAVAGDRVEPGPGADPVEVGLDLATEVAPRDPPARASSSWRCSPAISLRSRSFRLFRLPTSSVRSWADSVAGADAAGLGPELDDDEQAEQERDGRDEEPGCAGARRDRLMVAGRRRRRHGVRCDAGSALPANAGMSTFSGSANEMSSPNVPRRVWMKSRQPCERPSWSSRSARADRRTWYGGAR